MKLLSVGDCIGRDKPAKIRGLSAGQVAGNTSIKKTPLSAERAASASTLAFRRYLKRQLSRIVKHALFGSVGRLDAATRPGDERGSNLVYRTHAHRAWERLMERDDADIRYFCTPRRGSRMAGQGLRVPAHSTTIARCDYSGWRRQRPAPARCLSQRSRS